MKRWAFVVAAIIAATGCDAYHRDRNSSGTATVATFYGADGGTTTGTTTSTTTSGTTSTTGPTTSTTSTTGSTTSSTTSTTTETGTTTSTTSTTSTTTSSTSTGAGGQGQGGGEQDAGAPGSDGGQGGAQGDGGVIVIPGGDDGGAPAVDAGGQSGSTHTVEVDVIDPDQAKQHAYHFELESGLPFLSSDFVGKWATFKLTNVPDGTELAVNGTTDGKWWAYDNLVVGQVFRVRVDGKPVFFAPIDNGKKGANIAFTVKASVCPANDQDCDGSLVGADCNDSDQAIHPGQLETVGDNVDYDCIGGVDPLGGQLPGSAHTVEVDVIPTDQSTSHALHFEVESGIPFVSADASGKWATFKLTNVPDGIELQVNGTTDGKWWAHDNNVLSDILRVRIDGKAAFFAPKSNGKLGSNIFIMVKTSACPANDQDCDGSLVGADCNDSDQAIHPGQLETVGDNVDYDCVNGADSQGGQVPPSGQTGTLTLRVRPFDQTASRFFQVYDAGKGQFVGSLTATTVDVTLPNLPSDTDVYWNGTMTDAGSTIWWLGANCQATVLFDALWNGKPAQVSCAPNQNGGSNYRIHTAQLVCAWNDQDCDGYIVGVDCDVNDRLVHPGQIETVGDNVDMDCVNGLDSVQWQFFLSDLPNGYEVQLVDSTKWQNGDFVAYPMSQAWSPSLAKWGYLVNVSPATAPRHFQARWRQNGGAWIWSTWKNGQGNCEIERMLYLWSSLSGQKLSAHGPWYLPQPGSNCHQVADDL